MAYTLTQAAAAVAREKSTILRSIRAGRLSATRDAATRAWRIEPAELHRLYPATPDATADAPPRNPGATAEATWEARLETERAKVALLESEVADLRRRLDGESEERRRLTAVLSDQRARRRWWRFG